MSIRLMTAAWQTDLPALEKLILLALADNANDEGVAWPSIATISLKTGCSERTVQRNLRELEIKGHLSTSEARGRSNRYNLHPRQSDTPDPRHRDTPPPPDSHPTPVTETPHPRQRDTLTSIEPSIEPSGEPTHTFAREAARAVCGTPPRPKKIPMPADWQPQPLPADVAELVAQWPTGRLKTELAEFREYWIEDGERRPGWDRTWRSRIRTIHDRVMKENRNGRHGQADRGSASGDRGSRDTRDGFQRHLDDQIFGSGRDSARPVSASIEAARILNHEDIQPFPSRKEEVTPHV